MEKSQKSIILTRQGKKSAGEPHSRLDDVENGERNLKLTGSTQKFRKIASPVHLNLRDEDLDENDNLGGETKAAEAKTG